VYSKEIVGAFRGIKRNPQRRRKPFGGGEASSCSSSMAISTQTHFAYPSPQLPWSSSTTLHRSNFYTSSPSSLLFYSLTSTPSGKLCCRPSFVTNPSSLNLAQAYPEDREEEEEEKEGDEDGDGDFAQVLDSDGGDDLHNGHGNGSLFSIKTNERSVVYDEDGDRYSETLENSDRFKLQHGREVSLHMNSWE
jgi:hypothetical protein